MWTNGKDQDTTPSIGAEARAIRDRLLAEQAAKAKPPAPEPQPDRTAPAPDPSPNPDIIAELIGVITADPQIQRAVLDALQPSIPKPEPKYRKRKKPIPDGHETMADLHDTGHQYCKPARAVVMHEGISPLALALYVYLDALCHDGKWDKKEALVKAPEYRVKVSRRQIGKHFGNLDPKTVKKGLDELRDMGYLYKEKADFKPGQYDTNIYELPFRQRRLEQEEENRQRRRDARSA